MRPEDWQRLDLIFHHLLTLAADARQAYLDAACAGDAELRSEVEAVLAAHLASGGSEDQLLTGVPAPPEPGSLVGARIGHYRLEERVGRGGMGEVYRARRTDHEYERQVAIKVVRAGRDSAEMIRRFRIERQILARLEHPNIATLLDGGLTEAGQPYLVMPFVGGAPITAYADQRRLGLAERLALFGTVCDAVQFAHANLVVHRDIKPSNVLVTDEGQVRLLDFGIAKLLSPADFGTTAATTTGDLLLLTPEHAAPEQFLGDPVTTATDVYGLGVLLYELLAGVRPFQFVPPLELHRAVCERDPARPSRALLEPLPREAGNPAPVARAAARGSDPATLARGVRGDLDAIVLKALRKEPARRYASAGQLAEDVTRYLEGQPVIARPDRLGYRVRKFVRRNRLAVAMAALAAVLLIGAGGLTARQSRRRAVALAQAEAERAQATRVTEFMIGVFRASDPAAMQGRTVTARELLDRAADRVAKEFGATNPARADMEVAIGRAYLALGLFEPASTILDDAVAVRQGARVVDSVTLAAALVWSGRAEAAAGRVDSGVGREARALAIQERRLGSADPVLAGTLLQLGKMYRQRDFRDRLDSAKMALDRALAIERAGPDSDQRVIADILRTRGVNAMDRGHDTTSLADLREAVAVGRAAVGDDDPSMFNIYEDLALGYSAAGKVDSAIAIHRRLLAARERIFGPDHMDVSYSVYNLARELGRAKRFDEALPLFRRVVEMRQRLAGPNHYTVCFALHSYAVATAQSGDLAGSAELFQRAAKLCEAARGPRDSVTLDAVEGLAIVRAMQHRDGDALTALETAVSRGYDRVARLKQPPFDRLAGNPRFQRLLGRLAPSR